MVRYSWWRESLGVIFMSPDFPHSIFDPLSCTRTQWIVNKFMIEHSLHSVLICDIHTPRFPLHCSRAAVCPCMLFRVHCHPHSEGCAGLFLTEFATLFKYQVPRYFWKCAKRSPRCHFKDNGQSYLFIFLCYMTIKSRFSFCNTYKVLELRKG